MTSKSLNRRSFVKVTSIAGGGVAIAMILPENCNASLKGASGHINEEKALVPNAFVKIYPSNKIVFILDRVEMGQGTMTSHAQILCEELEVEPSRLVIELAGADKKYSNPLFGLQLTGGSTSVAASFKPLREAGALARELMRATAAKRWNADLKDCIANKGTIIHSITGKIATYGELANDASHIKIKTMPELKKPEDYKYIGHSQRRLDSFAKVTGTAVFGIDVSIPNLHSAIVIHCPTIGGTPKSFNEAEIKKIPGVTDTLMLPNSIVIVANKYWQALAASKQLKIEWDHGPLSNTSSESIFSDFEKAFELSPIKAKSKGDLDEGFKSAVNIEEATYRIPFLAHATMEPQNCTAHVTQHFCEVWGPFQNPAMVHEMSAQTSGLSKQHVKVNQTLMGGGFGRRISYDFAVEAVTISKMTSKPVKVIWSREEDMRNDFYRPAAVHKIKAGLTKDGQIAAWSHKIAAQSLLAHQAPAFVVGTAPDWIPYGVRQFIGDNSGKLFKNVMLDTTVVEGASDTPYDFTNFKVDFHHKEVGIPVGFWRSVGHSSNAFVMETFVDELANKAKEDPLEFRIKYLKKSPRIIGVLNLVAEKSQWKTAAPKGIFRGIAQHTSFGSFCAQVVEIKLEKGIPKLHRIVAAIDCGLNINPDLVAAQIESSIVFGLSAALKGKITFEKGVPQQTNFHDYEVLRMSETPKIEVHIVQSNEPPTGVGEPGLPPVAPALANAFAAATGKRLRSLPLQFS